MDIVVGAVVVAVVVAVAVVFAVVVVVTVGSACVNSAVVVGLSDVVESVSSISVADVVNVYFVVSKKPVVQPVDQSVDQSVGQPVDDSAVVVGESRIQTA